MRTALVVEDDVDLRRAYAAYLEPFKLDLVFVDSVRAARKAVKERGPFALVVVDGNVTDGHTDEFVRELRNGGYDSRIVGATGSPQSLTRLRKAGCDRVYRKPEELTQLMKEFTM